MRFSISEVARLTGLSTHTLRYYDECGLLPEVRRTASGHRQFEQSDLEWIDILKCLRATGMPLADIQRFTDLVQQGLHTAPVRRRLLEKHRSTVVQHQKEIERALSRIDKKINTYRQFE